MCLPKSHFKCMLHYCGPLKIFLPMVISRVGVPKVLLHVLVTMSQSCWLRYERKFSYIGHRRFLGSDHKFRNKKKSFDGNVDMRLAPITVSGGEIMLQTDAVADHVFGKKKKLI